MFEKVKNNFSFAKSRLSENSCDALFWLLDVFRKVGGFSLFMDKMKATFWCIYFALLFYVYIAGTVSYNQYYAREVIDFVNSFFNISILVLSGNSAVWTVIKRKDLKIVLESVKKNDDLVKESARFGREYEEMLKDIKRYVLACYMFHFVNDVLIYTTQKAIETNDLTISSCIGLNPLAGTPNIEICKAMLVFQECTAIIVVSSYDAMLIFLTTHTTAMFNLLHLETAELRTALEADDTSKSSKFVSDRLKNISDRHAKVLETVRKLQNIYSVALGIDFGNNAVSACLFFVLPLDICLKFGPLVYHNLIVFFLYCLLGQRLTTASEKFEIGLYSCGWENFSLKEKRTILFMIKRSQQPVILLAANIVPIRIYTFASTMQLIYKFVTVFKV